MGDVLMRLIDADEAIENIEEWIDSVGIATIGKGLSYYAELMGCIDDAQTVYAEPVRHGKWIRVNDEFSQCSSCKYPVYASWGESKYCPNCGCVMVGEEQ